MTSMRIASALTAATCAAVLSATGCDTNTPPTLTEQQSRCGAGIAEVEVNDGFLRALCGCAESSTTPVIPPATLTCTVAAGTTVFFMYQGTQLQHQIVSTGTPTFEPSALNDPTDLAPIVVHAVKFDTAGTYEFVDSMNHSVSGRIKAQ